MGFGTLFIGFLFLLNISYFAYTDVIAGLIICSALVRLSPYHRYFRLGAGCAACLSLYGLSELLFTLLSMFGITVLGTENAAFLFGLPRYALLCLLTVCVLAGIRALADEVDAGEIREKARLYLPVSVAVWILRMIAEIPAIDTLLGKTGTMILYLGITLIEIVYLVFLLFLLYRTYMVICLPEDADMPDKPSRFSFVREHEERVAERDRAFVEKQREKLKQKNENRNKRK